MPTEIRADLPAALVPIAWLVGRWEGAGVGGYPGTDDFRFGQEVTFSVEGAQLAYDSRTWRLADDGTVLEPLARESGYWRPGAGGTVEVLLAHPAGWVEIYLGEVDGAKIELRTDVVARTETAEEYSAGHRLYGQVEGDLAWVYEKAAGGRPLTSHLSARLKRVAGGA